VVGIGGIYCGNVTCGVGTGVLSVGECRTLLWCFGMLVWYRGTEWWGLVDDPAVM
jgi:hypothetical protein